MTLNLKFGSRMGQKNIKGTVSVNNTDGIILRWRYHTIRYSINLNTEWNPQKFMATASAISEVVAQYIAKILAREQYPEQSYKSCSGVLNFAKRVGNTRLTNACKRADSFGVYNYGIIDQILRSKAGIFIYHKTEKPLIEKLNKRLPGFS